MKTPLLKKQIVKIFQKYGLSKDHALISANALINAELVGAYGHGLSRLKMYCDRISKKVINPKPKIYEQHYVLTQNLKKEVIKIFKKYGLSNNHALISANALINAELVGAYGHGLSRLKMYCDRISKKVINPKDIK